MKRHFFISDNLDDLEQVEKNLEQHGIRTPQFHVLTSEATEAEAHRHNLHTVEAVLKKDVVRSTELGALVGIAGAPLVLTGAYIMGATDGAAGWMPWLFLSIIVLGFCTWEGGLLGMQTPHYQLKRFNNALKKGRHVLFVDVERSQQITLLAVIEKFQNIRPAGTGEAAPALVVKGRKKWEDFVEFMP